MGRMDRQTELEIVVESVVESVVEIGRKLAECLRAARKLAAHKRKLI